MNKASITESSLKPLKAFPSPPKSPPQLLANPLQSLGFQLWLRVRLMNINTLLSLLCGLPIGSCTLFAITEKPERPL